MIADDICRRVVNASIHRIRAIVRWGVRNELVHESIWRALLSVPALRRDEEGVRESELVRPARWRQLRAVLRHAPDQVRAMVRVQVLTGMRPGEIVHLCPGDIDRSGDVWVYTPPRHKTSYRGKARHILIGVRAQAILAPWLLRVADRGDYVFRPRQSLTAAIAARQTPPRWPCHAPSLRRRRKRARGVKPRRFRTHYKVDGYRRAIRRACETARPMPRRLARAAGETAVDWRRRLTEPQWSEVVAWRREHLLHPHQLRHNFATRVAKRFGEEAAQKLLGHDSLDVTRLYVERNLEEGKKIIAQIG